MIHKLSSILHKYTIYNTLLNHIQVAKDNMEKEGKKKPRLQ
jgi:hypothetical protein